MTRRAARAEWRAPRPDPDRRRCDLCDRVFAAGYVPARDSQGPLAGMLVCRDCRTGARGAAA